MIVRELIEILSGLPPDLPVVHSTGTMQDLEIVGGWIHGKPGEKMWTGDNWTSDGEWIELL